MTTLMHKSISAALRQGAGSDGTPTAEQTALINGFTLREFKPEELYTRTFVLAHNCIDRDRECIDESLLEQFAKTIPGKGLFNKHPMGWDGNSGHGEGRWYAAHTERLPLKTARERLREPELQLPPDRSEVVLLVTSAYIAKTPSSAELIVKMDAGVAGDVSIGFSAASRAPVVDPVSKSVVCDRINGPGEGLEGSIVWLGSQTGARAYKNAKEPVAMTPEQLAALKAALGSHASLLDTPTSLKAVLDLSENHKAAAGKYDALKSAFGTQADLLDHPAQLLAMVEEGKSYTTGLIDDLIAADRTAVPPRCGDAPEAVAAQRKLYGGYGGPQLKHLHTVLVSKGTGASIAAGDPNATKPVPANGGKAATPSIV